MSKTQAFTLIAVLIGGIGLARVVSHSSPGWAVLIAVGSFLYFTYGKGELLKIRGRLKGRDWQS